MFNKNCVTFFTHAHMFDACAGVSCSLVPLTHHQVKVLQVVLREFSGLWKCQHEVKELMEGNLKRTKKKLHVYLKFRFSNRLFFISLFIRCVLSQDPSETRLWTQTSHRWIS